MPPDTQLAERKRLLTWKMATGLGYARQFLLNFIVGRWCTCPNCGVPVKPNVRFEEVHEITKLITSTVLSDVPGYTQVVDVHDVLDDAPREMTEGGN